MAALGQLVLTWNDKAGLTTIHRAVAAIETGRARTGLRRAINHTGDKTYTLVRRTLAKQMGLSAQKAFDQHRALKKKRASDLTLQYEIQTTGGAIPMKEFNARKLGRGWSAAPWGKRRKFRHAFAVKRWGGNLYQRRTAARFPLEKLYGPNVSKELVKDATATAFHAIVSRDLPPRVMHELMRIIQTGK